jgi:undecaprenyl-diphosphatase
VVNREKFIESLKWLVDCDVAACTFLNRISHPPLLRSFFVSISRLGDGWIWYAFILLLPIVYGEISTALDLIKVGLVNLAVYKVLKTTTARSRPCAANAGIALGTAPLDQYSFPSGHTMHAVAFTMVLTAEYPELSIGLVPFSSLIALSRIVLGLHYPTDVIAGAVIGGYVASVLLAF